MSNEKKNERHIVCVRLCGCASKWTKREREREKERVSIIEREGERERETETEIAFHHATLMQVVVALVQFCSRPVCVPNLGVSLFLIHLSHPITYTHIHTHPLLLYLSPTHARIHTHSLSYRIWAPQPHPRRKLFDPAMTTLLNQPIPFSRFRGGLFSGK